MIIHCLVGDLAFGWPPLSNILFMGSPNMLIQGVSLRDDQNSTHGGRRTETEKCVLHRRSGPAGSIFLGQLDICPCHTFGWHFSEVKGWSSSGIERRQLHAGFWLGCPITPPPCPSIPPVPCLSLPANFWQGSGTKAGPSSCSSMMPRAESICFPGNSYFEDVRR